MRVAFLFLFGATWLGRLALALLPAFLTPFGVLLPLRGRSGLGFAGRAGPEVQLLGKLLQDL